MKKSFGDAASTAPIPTPTIMIRTRTPAASPKLCGMHFFQPKFRDAESDASCAGPGDKLMPQQRAKNESQVSKCIR